jgi:hypothetical protein
MSAYVGDFRLGDTFDVKFTTVAATGAPTTLAGTPVVSAYVGNSTTEITAGITLSVDFDGRTGLHNVRVVASSGNGYATASNYQLVITTGTVSGVSVVGYVIGQFSIEARSALMPTTAARTLDVSAGGEAGVDWANVGTPGSTVNLSATTTNVVNTAAAVTTVNGLAANVITAEATAADFTTEIQSGLATAAALDAVDNFVDTEVTSIKTVVDAIQAKTDNLPSDPADASVVAGLIAGVDTKVDTVDAVVEAIKVKTDSLTFTAAGHLDANILKVNGVTIIGNGAGTPFNV